MNAPARRPRLHLILARDRHGVIGRDGKLPWHLPEDLAHFKRTTLSHPVIMGRATWESLPASVRPLPGRRNIVLTRDAHWSARGAERAASFEQALDLCAGAAEAWVIGGARVFAEAMPRADRVVITEIDAAFEGDTHAPDMDASWCPEAGPWLESAGGLRYRIVNWIRA